MTAATKAKKPVKKSAAGKKARPQLPPSAGITVVDGREFVIMPLDDFEEWQDEQAFAALMRERIESDEPTIPFSQMMAKLNKGRKGR